MNAAWCQRLHPRIQIALATGASIVVLAWFSKRVLPEPLGNLEMALPPFLGVLFEGLVRGRGVAWYTRPRIGVLVVLAATAAVIGLAWSRPAGAERVVFNSARSGDGDIYAVDPAERVPVLVTGTPASEGAVRYDAARRRLVHHRYTHDTAMLVTGADTLFCCPHGETPPAWSPDGAWIAYAARRDGRENLYLARPDGTGEVRLTTGEFSDREPAWSPDGVKIVFARRLTSGWDLHVMTPEQGQPSLRRLTRLERYVGHPVWSPDGRRIAFDALYDGQAEIAVVELASGQVTRLTNRRGNDLAPAWSGDGRYLAFAADQDGGGNWDVWLLEVDTGHLTRLTTHPGFDGGPVFVPAGVVEALGR